MAICTFALALMGIMTGCVKNMNNSGTPEILPPKEDYFDFKLKGDVNLSVNYDVPGLSAIIEVYDQNPMMTDSKTKKSGISPIYVAYTKDGKYEGKMNIPTAVTEAYVYTNTIAAPRCVKLDATATGFAYDINKEVTEVKTRSATWSPMPHLAMGLIDKTQFPYEVAATAMNGGKRNDNLFSITAWTPHGWECINANYYTMPATIGAASEEMGVVTARLNEFLNAQRKIDGNKSLLRNPADINLKVPATATDGMSVNLTYVGERASYYNTFGYYYYEDKGQPLTPAEFLKIRKYIVIPNVETDDIFIAVKPGETVKLLYFDENGTQSDKFPANYVIGWFLIANGFGNNPASAGVGGYTDGGVIKALRTNAYTSADAYTKERNTCMSDDTGNDRRFISLYDTKSKLRVIGIEDFLHTAADDYMDVMFVVQTSIDLGGGELPPIGPVDPEPEPAVWETSGTLAYEDIWPYGGDYDLNDVIVEYHRAITFGKDNIVTEINETFKPVQKDGSAAQDNFFACNYAKMGKVTLSEGVISEPNTSSIVVTASAKNTVGKAYTIVRDLSGENVTQEAAAKDFNPFIITKKYSTENRVEVHLPMYEMTSAADKSLMNSENAYYIAKDKLYPFAIDIPVAGFIPADETKRIDTQGQYPAFATWVTSKGEQAKDWYLQDKGAKK